MVELRILGDAGGLLIVGGKLSGELAGVAARAVGLKDAAGLRRCQSPKAATATEVSTAITGEATR